MRIAIEVELSEKVAPRDTVESRRFSRIVEMELPEIGHDIELNVSAELVTVNIAAIRYDSGDGLYHVKATSTSLTFASLRDDERWIEQPL